MGTSISDLAEALRERLVGQEVDGVAILSARVTPSGNPHAGEDDLTVHLIISDPRSGDTWELETTRAIGERTRDEVAAAGVSPSIVNVFFEPEHPDYGEDYDQWGAESPAGRGP